MTFGKINILSSPDFLASEFWPWCKKKHPVLLINKLVFQLRRKRKEEMHATKMASLAEMTNSERLAEYFNPTELEKKIIRQASELKLSIHTSFAWVANFTMNFTLYVNVNSRDQTVLFYL